MKSIHVKSEAREYAEAIIGGVAMLVCIYALFIFAAMYAPQNAGW
jgi:hypothetical protein